MRGRGPRHVHPEQSCHRGPRVQPRRGSDPPCSSSDKRNFRRKCHDKLPPLPCWAQQQSALVVTEDTLQKSPSQRRQRRGKLPVCTAEEEQLMKDRKAKVIFASSADPASSGWQTLMHLGKMSKGAECGKCCCSGKDWKKPLLTSHQVTSKIAHFL